MNWQPVTEEDNQSCPECGWKKHTATCPEYTYWALMADSAYTEAMEAEDCD